MQSKKLKRRIDEKRVESFIYPKVVVTDRYNNESYKYPDEPAYKMQTVYSPIQSEVEVAEYGERINEMLQTCIFDDTPLQEKDRVSVDGTMYNVESIRKYPSYRLVYIERVQ